MDNRNHTFNLPEDIMAYIFYHYMLESTLYRTSETHLRNISNNILSLRLISKSACSATTTMICDQLFLCFIRLKERLTFMKDVMSNLNVNIKNVIDELPSIYDLRIQKNPDEILVTSVWVTPFQLIFNEQNSGKLTKIRNEYSDVLLNFINEFIISLYGNPIDGQLHKFMGQLVLPHDIIQTYDPLYVHLLSGNQSKKSLAHYAKIANSGMWKKGFFRMGTEVKFDAKEKTFLLYDEVAKNYSRYKKSLLAIPPGNFMDYVYEEHLEQLANPPRKRRVQLFEKKRFINIPHLHINRVSTGEHNADRNVLEYQSAEGMISLFGMKNKSYSFGYFPRAIFSCQEKIIKDITSYHEKHYPTTKKTDKNKLEICSNYSVTALLAYLEYLQQPAVHQPGYIKISLTEFDQANFHSSYFILRIIIECSFMGTNLLKSNFLSSVVAHTDFDGAPLRYSNWQGTLTFRCDFSGADVNGLHNRIAILDYNLVAKENDDPYPWLKFKEEGRHLDILQYNIELTTILNVVAYHEIFTAKDTKGMRDFLDYMINNLCTDFSSIISTWIKLHSAEQTFIGNFLRYIDHKIQAYYPKPFQDNVPIAHTLDNQTIQKWLPETDKICKKNKRKRAAKRAAERVDERADEKKSSLMIKKDQLNNQIEKHIDNNMNSHILITERLLQMSEMPRMSQLDISLHNSRTNRLPIFELNEKFLLQFRRKKKSQSLLINNPTVSYAYNPRVNRLPTLFAINQRQLNTTDYMLLYDVRNDFRRRT